MITLRRIVVPTDLSDFSLAALEYASTLSLIYGADLFLLHVEDVVPPPMYTTHVADLEAGHFQSQTEAEVRKSLEQFAARKINPDLKAHLVLRLGHPVDEIIRFAEEERIDMIVMATHGRTGLKHVLMGSIAEKVVRNSSIPVLTVKPPPLRTSVVSRDDVENELHIR